jgi:hypothetical protein
MNHNKGGAGEAIIFNATRSVSTVSLQFQEPEPEKLSACLFRWFIVAESTILTPVVTLRANALAGVAVAVTLLDRKVYSR